MKLRNKKTGENADVKIDTYNEDGKGDRICLSVKDSDMGYRCIASYSSLAELNEEWEDYAPAEPLIKDEKIRKAVRAWAEACFNDKYFMVYDLRYVSFKLKADRSDATIALYVDEHYWIQFLVKNKSYTIAELCGEEE